MNTTYTRRYVFQSLHHLPSLGEGKHGHHMHLELSFSKVRAEVVDQIYATELAPELHGREISVVSPATGENIVEWIHERLLETSLGPHLHAVAIQETDKNRYISTRSEARFV